MFDLSKRNNKLLKHRIIGLHRELTRGSATLVISKLLYLQEQNSKSPIHLFINSPGGQLDDGLALVDTMNEIQPPVYTYGIGLVSGSALVVLSNGLMGFRYVCKNTHITFGTIFLKSEYDNDEKELSQANSVIARHYLQRTTQTYNQIQKDMNDNREFTPAEAKSYGIVDHVVPKYPHLGVISRLRLRLWAV